MAAFLIALYGQPTDTDAFDQYYVEQHAPVARRIPGVESIEISAGPALAPDGSTAFHSVAMLRFASMDDLQSGLAAPEGQATAGDLANFATGGVTLAMIDAMDVMTP